MIRRILFGVCALALAWPMFAGAQQPITGTVVRVDEPAGVVVLDDGRMYRLGGTRTVIVEDRAVAITSLRPGTRVLIRDAEPVVMHGDRYVVMPQTRIGQGGDPRGEARAAQQATTSQRIVEDPVTGRIARVDADARVVIFEDSRMFRLTEDGAVLVENRPVQFDTLRPGAYVTLRSAQPVQLRDGQYVVVQPMPAAGVSVTPPATGTTTVTTVTTAAAPVAVTDPVVRGRLTGYDPATGLVMLSDGRAVYVGPSTVVLVNERVVPVETVRPGTAVTVTAVNPIVYRDGRYALMNEGFVDDNGSLLAADAKYAGYEAATSDAAMQIQAGGGGGGGAN